VDLWSKGLGKRVLSLSLGERTGAAVEQERLMIEGVMHAPVYWDYEVGLEEGDVIDFLTMLRKSESVRFLATSGSRWRILGTAGVSGAVFLGRTLRRMLGGGPSRLTSDGTKETADVGS